jgi:hypothetical protein
VSKEANPTLSYNPGNVGTNGQLGGEGRYEGRTVDGQYRVA